jgi:hypothetical protein
LLSFKIAQIIQSPSVAREYIVGAINETGVTVEQISLIQNSWVRNSPLTKVLQMMTVKEYLNKLKKANKRQFPA